MDNQRHRDLLEQARDLAGQSPAEALVDQELLPPPSPEAVEPRGDVQTVFPPWEPKGATALGVPPAETIQSAPDTRFSDPPPRTAGGAPPRHHRPLGQFGPDDGSV